MKTRQFLTSFLIILTFVLLIHASEVQLKDIEGIWQGTLNIQGMEIRVVFHIQLTDLGIYEGTMDSPDQGASGLKLDVVQFQENTLTIELKQANIRYEANLIDSGEKLDGRFKQSGYDLPLEMKRIEEVEKITRPQDPIKPYPYLEEEVSFLNQDAGIKLAGTLTLPEQGSPFPAVFRVDDRGVGGSTGNVADSTSVEFAQDVLAGVEFLKKRKDIDSKKIGLIGHSEGGLIAPIAAAQSDDVAFIVLMAGTGLTGEEIIYLQSRLIALAGGVKNEKIEQNLADQRKIFTVVKGSEGEKDLQVPPKENLAAIEHALKEAGNTHVTLKELPGLNHLFQKASTGSPSEYIKIDETINPEVLTLISSWILEMIENK
jgi:dienelactone hydrolase